MSEPVPVLLPQVNVNDDSVLMVQWLVERGAAVSAGDEICIVETTKAATSLACDQSRTVPLTHRGAVRQQGVPIGEIGIGVNRDGGHLELAVESAPVQGLDVLQLVNEAQIAGVEKIGGQRIKHERVVRVRRVGDANGPGHGLHR